MYDRLLSIGIAFVVAAAGISQGAKVEKSHVKQPASPPQASPPLGSQQLGEPIEVEPRGADRKCLEALNKVGDFEFNEDDYSKLLRDYDVVRLGDYQFLVGKVIDDGATLDWSRRRTIWISFEEISEVVEFDDLEQYKKAAALTEATAK